MTNHPSPELDPSVPARLLVLPVRVGGAVAIDLFANAALRWLCRAGLTQGVRIVGVAR